MMGQEVNEGIFSYSASMSGFALTHRSGAGSALALPGKVPRLGLKWEDGMGCLLTQVTVSLGSLGQAAYSCAGSRESAAESSLGCGALLLCMTLLPEVIAQASGERAAQGKRPDSRYVSPLLGPPS